jgi:hypothetical protein
MKTRAVGAELFRADRRTDITKLTVAFHNLANAPKPELMTIAPDVLWLLALCIRVCNA